MIKIKSSGGSWISSSGFFRKLDRSTSEAAMTHHLIQSGYAALVERINRFPQGAPSGEALYKILSILFSEKDAALVARLPIKPFTAEQAARGWKMKASEVIKTASLQGISLCYCRHKMHHMGKDCAASKEICMTFNGEAAPPTGRHAAQFRSSGRRHGHRTGQAAEAHLRQSGPGPSPGHGGHSRRLAEAAPGQAGDGEPPDEIAVP